MHSKSVQMQTAVGTSYERSELNPKSRLSTCIHSVLRSQHCFPKEQQSMFLAPFSQAVGSHLGACFLCHPELKGPYPISEASIKSLSLGTPR